MSDKKVIYVCEKCPHQVPCISITNLPSDTMPTHCPYGMRNFAPSDWQKTDKYEITRKKPGLVIEPSEPWPRPQDLGMRMPPPKRKVNEDIRVDRLVTVMKSFFNKIQFPMSPSHYKKWCQEVEEMFPTFEETKKEMSLKASEDIFKQWGDDMNRKNQTPNCSICAWRVLEDSSKDMLGRVIRQDSLCSAQGDRYIKNVYGNKICKRLFSVPPKEATS